MDLLTRLVMEASRLPQMHGYMAIDRQELRDDLKAAMPIRIQNVADYLFLETDQESFHLSQDFPNVAPPWPIFFMSYRMPARLRLKDKWSPNKAAGLECGHLFTAEKDDVTGDCKNVDILREPVPPKIKAKRERAHGWSPSAGHSLRIEPMRRQLTAAGANEPGGLKRSLHIMRGHFKDYRDGRGLFGKIHGMRWWDFRLSDSSHKHRYEIKPSAD